MKQIALILLIAVGRTFAADDTNLVVAGDWSQPVTTPSGPAIRGRLLICDTPDHASSEHGTDTAVYLELQEFSSAVRSVRVYCGLHRLTLPDDSPGLRCELRDNAGRLVPDSPGGFSGSEPTSYWLTLHPYCSARLRVSAYGAACRLKDGGLHINLASRGQWDVHPNPTNDYYLSGTFSSVTPTNELGLKLGLPIIDCTNMDVWYGTLTLPSVKIPMKKP